MVDIMPVKDEAQFSETELYYLWYRFRNDIDGGLEALCGFMGIGWGQDNRKAKTLLRDFQARAEAQRLDGVHRGHNE